MIPVNFLTLIENVILKTSVAVSYFHVPTNLFKTPLTSFKYQFSCCPSSTSSIFIPCYTGTMLSCELVEKLNTIAIMYNIFFIFILNSLKKLEVMYLKYIYYKRVY